MSFLEGFRFKPRESPVHRLDPRSKFVLLVCYTIISLAFTEFIPLLLIFFSTVAWIYAARSLREWARTMRGVAFFLLVIFLLNMVSVPENRLNYSIAMVLRFAALTSIFSLFFLTTTPDELALAMEVSGVPRDYSLMFTMSLRFVPTLARDLQIVMDALRSRGLELEGGNFIERVKNYSYLLVPLIVYEIRRSLMIAEALEARGYGAVKKVEPYYELRFSSYDYLLTIGCSAAVAFIAVARVLGLLPPWVYYTLPEPL